MTADDFPQLRRLARMFALMAAIGARFLVTGIVLAFHSSAGELPAIGALLGVGFVACLVGLRSLRKTKRTISNLRMRH